MSPFALDRCCEALGISAKEVEDMHESADLLPALLAQVALRLQYTAPLNTGRHSRPDQQLPALLRSIYRVLGSSSFGTRQLLESALHDDELAQQLNRFLGPGSGSVRLGRYLGAAVGQSAGGYRLQGCEVSGTGSYEVIEVRGDDLIRTGGR
jgi:hypothetical protein